MVNYCLNKLDGCRMMKVKAVTIIETIVSLIIFSLVVGAGYYAYKVLDKYCVNYMKRNNLLTQGVELQYLLYKDCEMAERIFATGDSVLTLHSTVDTIQYHFTQEGAYRQISGRTINIHYAFSCTIGQTEEIQINSGRWLTKIVIYYVAGTSFYIPINKDYSSAQIVNYGNE